MWLGARQVRPLRLPHPHVQREAAARDRHQGAHQAPGLAHQLIGAPQAPDNPRHQHLHPHSRHALGGHHRPNHRDLHVPAEAPEGECGQGVVPAAAADRQEAPGPGRSLRE